MRILLVLLGALCAFTAYPQTTGGYPSRPKFASVGVNVAAPSTNGNISASGNINATNLVANAGLYTVTLDATGATNLSSLFATSMTTFKFYGGYSTVASPSVSFTAEPDTGMFLETSGLLDFAVDGVLRARLSANGLTVNGVSVSHTYTAVMPNTITRANTAAATCEATLTVTLPVATARYRFTADLVFAGGGITANGWRVTMITAGGTGGLRWTALATTNTTVANTPPISQLSSIADPITATFNAAGIDTGVTISGVLSVSAPTAPTICLGWAQNTSNAQGTQLLGGSSLVVTRVN